MLQKTAMNNTVLENQILENSTTIKIDRIMKENRIYKPFRLINYLRYIGLYLYKQKIKDIYEKLN